MSDHPLSPSGVGTQTRYIIESMLKTGKYSFVSFGGAIKHSDYTPLKPEPYGDDWIQTSGWKLRDVDELVLLAEQLFPGFKLRKNLGQVDKHRYILELVMGN